MRETSLQETSRGEYDSRERGVGGAQQSIERDLDLDLNSQDENQMRLSHLQCNLRSFQTRAILLLNSGHDADLNAGKKGGETPLFPLIEGEYFIQGYWDLV